MSSRPGSSWRGCTSARTRARSAADPRCGAPARVGIGFSDPRVARGRGGGCAGPGLAQACGRWCLRLARRRALEHGRSLDRWRGVHGAVRYAGVARDSLARSVRSSGCDHHACLGAPGVEGRPASRCPNRDSRGAGSCCDPDDVAGSGAWSADLVNGTALQA